MKTIQYKRFLALKNELAQQAPKMFCKALKTIIKEKYGSVLELTKTFPTIEMRWLRKTLIESERHERIFSIKLTTTIMLIEALKLESLEDFFKVTTDTIIKQQNKGAE